MESEGKHLQCKRCGKFFDCRVHDIKSCQCSTVKLMPATLNFLQHTSWGCLCSRCLEEVDLAVASIQGQDFPEPADLVEEVHYHYENELLVFTEYYHMLRGYCCKSGCRHCVYGFER